jgi:hypothetical protein
MPFCRKQCLLVAVGSIKPAVSGSGSRRSAPQTNPMTELVPQQPTPRSFGASGLAKFLSGRPAREASSQLFKVLTDMSNCRDAFAGPIDSASESVRVLKSSA